MFDSDHDVEFISGDVIVTTGVTEELDDEKVWLRMDPVPGGGGDDGEYTRLVLMCGAKEMGLVPHQILHDLLRYILYYCIIL